MRPLYIAAALALLSLPARAQIDHSLLHQLSAAVSPAELKASDTKLVGFGTRHTLSDTVSETRGIGATRRWVKSRFEAIAADCGGCLQVLTPSQMVTGERIPKPAEIMDVLAIQRGSDEPNRVVIISAHMDSRVTDPMNATSDAPGADDNGSGTSAVLEAARLLSKHKFRATIVFAVLSGEEQAEFGGKLLADYATAQGWQVEADLNNDIIGNSTGLNGVHDDGHIRIFSEGTRAVETPAEANVRRYNGGEVDSPSRNLARFVAGLDRYVPGLKAMLVYRTDRYSRGSDQVPMLNAGFPALRLTEARENYNRQHQDVRTENGIAYGDVLSGVDFDYLSKAARLNIVALAALASAPPPPMTVKITGALADDTSVSWSAAPGAAAYKVWWRATTDPVWKESKTFPGVTSAVMKDLVIDDWFFGVSSVSADGYESPVEFPGAAGAFFSAPK